MNITVKDANTQAQITTFSVSPGTINNVPASVNASCVTNIPTFCVQERDYTGTWTVPSGTTVTNGIIFEFQGCCRNGSISNITNPNSAGNTWLVTTLPGGVGLNNSTPVFTVDPPTVVASGAPTTVDFAATDADGDSLFYEFTDALDDGGAGAVPYVAGFSGASPLPSNPAATINDNTGTISANLNQQGQYVVAVRVTEFRNGIALTRIQREYQFNIASFSTMTAAVDPSTFVPITCGSTRGTLGIAVTNATAPLTYLWNTGATTAVVPNQPAGTYSVTVTDNLGCVDSVELTLASESDLNFQTTTKNPTCEAADDGEISATIGAAQGPYDFELNAVSPTTSTATSAMWDNLDTGDYIMIVEDSTGNCVA